MENVREKKISKKQKKAEDTTALLPALLKEKCADTVASASNALELTAKITEMKNTSTGKGTKKDFTSTYAEVKAKEIELAKLKYDLKKENSVVKREEKRHEKEASRKHEFKKAIMVEMIRACLLYTSDAADE